ncbi:hypothetical protein FRB99_005965 [Tulasnella sp. 403]|nr:hypothetical protein FRB99_005965 [Tulasnella sp. 403]
MLSFLPSLQRVMKELMAWAKLRHENVLPMLGHLTVPDVLFFSEWSDNGHVLRYVKATKATREDRLRLMRECASGLLYLHENSVIHGDLRHDNILVTNDGRAAISDFGLSKLVEGNSPRSVTVDVTTSIECKGSKFYMAPELLVTKDHPKPKRSMAVDVYAFGILIIEIGGAKEAFGERVHRWYIRMEEYVAGDMNPSPEIFPDLQNRGPLWELSRACMVFMPIERLDMEHCEAALSGLGERLHEVFTSKVRVAETE